MTNSKVKWYYRIFGSLLLVSAFILLATAPEETCSQSATGLIMLGGGAGILVLNEF